MFNIVCCGDYTYSTDLEGKNIIRIKNSAYLKSNKQIKLYSSMSLAYTPFGCGYNIRNELVSDEELALALLSQDPDFDICSINSLQDISANIRNKGSFYPLNDVKAVKEYLDLCFPYIKEAAINSDGDIWMLPIYVDIPYFLYNESFCQSKGIEFSNSMNIEQLISTINRVKTDESLREFYLINNKFFTKYLFYQYLRKHSSFNTELFRNLAPSVKNTFNYINSIGDGNNLMYLNVFNMRSDFLFLYHDDSRYLLDLADNKVIRAASIPSLTDNTSNVATCYFLVVNPASKNLKATLQYISSLCKYLLSYNDDYLILKDRSLYPDTQLMDDIYEIYSNGDIQFTYPDELFMDAFEKYLADGMDLDSFIVEADRRLDTFLKE